MLSQKNVSLAGPLFLSLAGLVGLAVHASYLYSPQSPSYASGSALNVILSSLTFFFSLESIWLYSGGVPLSSGIYAALCRSLPLLVVPVLAILLAVGYRLDAAGWCLPLFGVLLLSAKRQYQFKSVDAVSDPASPRLLGEHEDGR